MRRLKHLVRDSKGASAVEYGLIISLTVLAMMAALSTLADTTTGTWNEVSNEVVGD